MTRYPDALTAPIAIVGDQPECLTEIFRNDVNLAVWQRTLSPEIAGFAEAFALRAGTLERFVSLEHTRGAAGILPDWALALPHAEAWLEDVAQLVAMYRCLFEPAAVGLRLHLIKSTMCPRFHVDRVPARLLCTYRGTGTEWLSEPQVRRADKPGALPEQVVEPEHIQRLSSGAVALLKGEAWEGNEGRGLVHRSPANEGEPRLILGLDWLG
ncbi:DUF1826 domain-containing protein [Marinimicrobium alkaliphilum]|uniref:DUF1826 domain-containing protein n=1 Tax=Marinimicrobium alkaliphilum TaxID=2202654 RepID=UPI000DB90CA5|nr:DUF1826 domain-containing protein [Marinimicrobium alkaliphilum]